MTFSAFDAISIAGVILGMVAYTLMVSGRVRAESCGYMGANFVAALMVAFSLIDHWNPATAMLQCFYGAASFYGLTRLRLRARAAESAQRQPRS